jgi:exodeoxyribonuclease VII large subunit
MVLDSRGTAVTEAAAARKQAALTLKFRDGALDVVTAAAPRPSRAKPAPPGGEQPKLL